MFEPSEKVDSTVEMTIQCCYRWCERTKLHVDFPVWFGHYSKQKIAENPTPHAIYLKMTRGVDWHPKPKQALNRQRKKLNTNACGKKKKREKKRRETKKEAEHKSLWQNDKEELINTNARVKWKMAALIRQANNWNQMATWKGWWKWQRKIKEKEGWKKSIAPTRSKTVHGS